MDYGYSNNWMPIFILIAIKMVMPTVNTQFNHVWSIPLFDQLTYVTFLSIHRQIAL